MIPMRSCAVAAALWLATATSGCSTQPAARVPSPPAMREANGAQAAPQSPQQALGELFVAVQTSRLFGDNKVFVDAVPKSDPRGILERYRSERPTGADALRRFVEANFTFPPLEATAPLPAGQVSLTQHIDALWNALTREDRQVPEFDSLLPLPKPYVVPGGRFLELYYWDSYFTMLGLEASGRQDLLRDMVADFAYLIDRYGHVPNGTRTYYLSRSQPPFFFAMVGLLTPDDPAASWAKYLPELRREHAFWMRGEDAVPPGAASARVVRLRDGALLNRYWDDLDLPRDESYAEDVRVAQAGTRDPKGLYRDIRAAAESGWDFSSRWFADGRSLATLRTTKIAPVDLNSLLFGLESAIGEGCARRRETACADEYRQRATARHAAIDRYLWDAPSGTYLDYEWTGGSRPSRVTAATLYPLFFGLASKAQADSVGEVVRAQLFEDGGLVTTTVASGQQWDAPNGWAPLQWIAVAGLTRYRQDALAAAIACRWVVNVNRVYRESGKLVEKYDVVTTGRPGGGGEYPAQDGFGWTNGVTRKLIALYPGYVKLSSTEQCPAP